MFEAPEKDKAERMGRTRLLLLCRLPLDSLITHTWQIDVF